MARQNRVNPFGEIIATRERGTFLGNRGILHDDRGHIERPWALKRWLVCVLEFKGIRRTIMAPRRYTELFFLDEATALAAGHRPCAECRYRRFIAFCEAWRKAHAGNEAERPRADFIDAQLHSERVGPRRTKRSYSARLDDLPDGVFVTLPDRAEQAFLVLGGNLLAWSFGGYGEPSKRPKGREVNVLTPKSTVETIRAGYAPEIHVSARRSIS
jgi:hypothetical protein